MNRLKSVDYLLLKAAANFNYLQFRCPTDGVYAIKREAYTLNHICPICKKPGVRVDVQGNPISPA